MQTQLAELQQTMLRLSGAIMVLEEILTSAEPILSGSDQASTTASPDDVTLGTLAEAPDSGSLEAKRGSARLATERQ